MFESDVLDVPQRALTGDLPPESRVTALLREAHTRYASQGAGVVADYIPVLAEADPALFGLSLTEVDGTVHRVGDTDISFSIQSISKAFVLALVCEAIGHEEVHRIVGVNNTGLPFNSVIALELNDGSPMNPMVNAGALATTALMPGATAAEKWQAVQEGLSRFAGRRLEVDERVLASESASNHRNQGIADLLTSYGRLLGDPAEIVDVYTRQCSLLVTADDLAVMGATLADGGVTPVTGQRVVSRLVDHDDHVPDGDLGDRRPAARRRGRRDHRPGSGGPDRRELPRAAAGHRGRLPRLGARLLGDVRLPHRRHPGHLRRLASDLLHHPGPRDRRLRAQLHAALGPRRLLDPHRPDRLRADRRCRRGADPGVQQPERLGSAAGRGQRPVLRPRGLPGPGPGGARAGAGPAVLRLDPPPDGAGQGAARGSERAGQHAGALCGVRDVHHRLDGGGGELLAADLHPGGAGAHPAGHLARDDALQPHGVRHRHPDRAVLSPVRAAHDRPVLLPADHARADLAVLRGHQQLGDAAHHPGPDRVRHRAGRTRDPGLQRAGHRRAQASGR